MDPALAGFLLLSPQKLQAQLEARIHERQALRSSTATPTPAQRLRYQQLGTEIRTLHFAGRFQAQIALMDKDRSPRLERHLLWTLLAQLSRTDVPDRYRDSILAIISLVAPDSQQAVQLTDVRQGKVITLLMNMPLLLRNSSALLEVFGRQFLIFDERGRPIATPEHNRTISAAQSA
jgi:hypothetical protein